MLRAVGMGDDDWAKPQIGVASSWNEITPCNLSLDRLAKAVKDGVHAAGGYPLEFGTISVSATASRWATRACTSRSCSREIIADSVETVMQAERLDGSVLLAGCDKSAARHAHGRGPARPGQRLPLRRVDPAGHRQAVDGTEKTVTIIDAFEAVGACAARPDEPRGRRRASSGRSAPARAPAAACTPPTRWPRSPRPSGMSLPGSARAAGHRPAPRRVRPQVRRGRRRAAAPGHHRPRHHDQGGVRERHRRRHGLRRLDQRRAAPAGDRRTRPTST